MTRTTRLVLYGIATAADMVAGTLLFVAPVRAAQLGASYSLCAGLGAVWALGAALMTLAMGRVANSRNAVRLCLWACLFQALGHAVFFAGNLGPTAMLPVMFGIGLSHTFFYVPYQVFFKSVDAGAGLRLSSSVGVYTFAWSAGMAVGPLWSGFLMGMRLLGLEGWRWCFVFTIAALAVMGLSIVWIRGRRGKSMSVRLLGEEERLPDFSRLAWLAALCGSIAFSLIRGLFPAGAVKLGISEGAQGAVVFTMGILQALVSLALIRIDLWMYRPRVLAATGAFGIVGMTLFVLAFTGVFAGAGVVAAFLAGAFLFGVYSGAFYSYSTYHCLAHPTRAGYAVAMCEGAYAVGNIFGLIIGGALSDAYGVDVPYTVALAVLAAITAMQIYFHRKRPVPGDFVSTWH